MTSLEMTNSAHASAAPAAVFVPSLKNRIAGLDELRGVAILLVLICHGLHLLWGVNQYNAFSYVGVNIFFVISGYLICKILTNDRGNPGFFRTFYIRRIFRIWPLFLVITAFGLVVGLSQSRSVWAAVPYYLTFTMNFATERATDPAGGGFALIPMTDPMWSLAIEEQFYLFLPLLVHLVHPRRLTFVVTVLCCISVVGSLLMFHWTFWENPLLAYPSFKNTAVRFHYIGFGVLLALQPRLAYATILTWLAASALCFHFTGILEITVAFLLVSLIHFTICKRPVLRNRLLARAGFLCYGIYLIHWPVLRIFEKTMLPRFGASPLCRPVLFVVFMGISFLAAHWSFKYFENPIQKLRGRFERPVVKAQPVKESAASV